MNILALFGFALLIGGMFAFICSALIPILVEVLKDIGEGTMCWDEIWPTLVLIMVFTGFMLLGIGVILGHTG